MRATIQRYLTQYLRGELTSLEQTRKVRPLKATVGKDLLLTHFHQLRSMQDDPMIWTLGEDGFLETLQRQHPEVHEQWSKGKLDLRFFEALFALEQVSVQRTPSCAWVEGP